MNFEAAINALKAGAAVRRGAWPEGHALSFIPTESPTSQFAGAIRHTDASGNRVNPPVTKADMAATDWTDVTG